MGQMNKMVVRREFERERLNARAEGRTAGLAGHPDFANPWPFHSDLGRAWQLGWETGNHERLEQQAA